MTAGRWVRSPNGRREEKSLQMDAVTGTGRVALPHSGFVIPFGGTSGSSKMVGGSREARKENDSATVT